MKEIFENIYKTNHWKNQKGGTGSGPGSCIECSKPYLDFLQKLTRDNNIKTVVDLGCGDFNLMKYFQFDNINYTGVDIVPYIIEENNSQFKHPNINFIVENLITYYPPVKYDLVIIKDVLQHFSNINIIKCIRHITYSKYILITNDYTQFNTDCVDGGYRPVNLHIDPYSIKNLSQIFEFDSCGFYKTVNLITV